MEHPVFAASVPRRGASNRTERKATASFLPLLLIVASLLGSAGDVAARDAEPLQVRTYFPGVYETIWDGTNIVAFSETSYVHKYDPNTGVRTLIAQSGIPYGTVQSVGWDGLNAYLWGDWGTEILRYDPLQGKITASGKAMPVQRYDMGVAWSGEEFFLFGGWDYEEYGQTGHREIFRYDPKPNGGDPQTVAAQLPTPMTWPSAAWSGYSAYVFSDEGVAEFIPNEGGLSGETRLLQATTPLGLGCMNAVWTGGAAYFLGGCTESGFSNEVWGFYPTANGGYFSRTARLPSPPRGDVGMAWDGTYVYGVGGLTDVPETAYGTDQIIRYKPPSMPPTMSVEVAATLSPPVSAASAVWDAQRQVAYIFGGWTCTPTCHALDDIIRYDPSVASPFRVVGNLTSPRTGTSAVWTGTSAYIFGGLSADGGHALADILQFDPVTGQVSHAGSLPEATFDTSAVWTGTSAYIFGGGPNTWGVRSSKIFQFVPGTGASLAGNLPSPRSDTSAVWDGQAAYVFGGETPSNTVLDEIVRYDPVTGAQPTGAQLPTPRSGTSAVWDGRRAFVFGGFAPSSPGFTAFDETVVFYPATEDAMALHAALPSGRFDSMAVWAGKNAYILGGFPEGGQVLRFARVPQVRVTGPATYEATSPQGAAVDYTVINDPDVVVTCTSDAGAAFPGKVFPLGSHWIECTAKDHNDVSSSSEYDFTVADTSSPELSMALSGTMGTNEWYRSGVTATLECSDASGTSLTYRLDDGPATGYAGPPVTFSQQGPHTLVATCADPVPNTATESGAFKIDSVSPSGSTTPPGQAVGTYNVPWQAADATSGVVKVEVQEAGSISLSPGYTTVCTVTLEKASSASGTCSRSPAPGAYCYRIVVTDDAGNVFAESGPDPGNLGNVVGGIGSKCTMVG